MAKVVFVGNGRCGSLPCDPPEKREESKGERNQSNVFLRNDRSRDDRGWKHEETRVN